LTYLKIHILQLHEREFLANVNSPHVYVYCSTVQMFTRIGSISDTNLTFDITVITKNVHLNARYKMHVFVFIGVLCRAALRWFCITDGFSTCWHSPPWSVRRRPHTDWIYVHSTTHYILNKLSTCKCTIRLMYSYSNTPYSRLTFIFLTIRKHKHCQEYEC